MALTAFPGGVTSFGMPVGMADAAMTRYYGGGDVIWVGNRSDLRAGSGVSPTDPCSTIFGVSGAIAKLQSKTNRASVILVMPGHAENVDASYKMGTGTSTSSGTTNSFAVVGLGTGSARPTLTWSVTTSGSLLTMDTASVVLDNFILQSTGTIAPTIGVKVTGADCTIRNVYWKGSDAGGTANVFTTALQVTTGGDRFTLDNVRIIGGATTAMTDTCSIAAAVDQPRILDCTMIASLGTAQGLVTLGAAATNVEILRCKFANKVALSTVALKGYATATGFVDHILLETAKGTITAMNGTTLPETTIAAAFDTPGTLSVGRNVLVSLAAGKYGVHANLVTANV